MFVEKLNKKQEGVYVIEEEKTITDGKWEGFLDHDNVNHESITIYTGPKFTGQKVQNYFISTPSETPWKTYLKVFSNSEKIYITYETSGDQVEAEDINSLQGVLIDEIDRAKAEEKRIEEKLDDEITRSVSEDERLDIEVNKKADKTYVDTELNKRYTKDEVFNKEEVLQKIQDLIGTAPEALDTLAEIANALNNDPNFAATIINELAKKVDKVAGKGLSTEDYTTAEKMKLAGIEEGANKYIHPNAHPASIIVQDSTHRFVTDSEKDNWNAKETPKGAQEKADIAEENAKAYADSIKPTKLSQLQNDVGYITSQRPVSDSVTSTSSTTAASSKAVKTAYDRAVTAENNAKNYTDEHANDEIKHITTTERNNWNNKLDKTANAVSASKLATARTISLTGDVTGSVNFDGSKNVSISTTVKDDSHNHTIANIDGLQDALDGKANSTDIPTKVSELKNDKNFVTQEELGNAGYGDMLKSIYDTDNNGKVDRAEIADKVSWSGITGKPSTFTPSSHTHDKLNIPDTRNDEFNPSYYMNLGKHIITEFKYRNAVNNPPTSASANGTYTFVMTIVGWYDSSGGYPIQISFGKTNIAIRQGISEDDWSDWYELTNTSHSHMWDTITGKPTTFPPSSHNHSISNVSGLQSALDSKMSKGRLTWNDLKGV